MHNWQSMYQAFDLGNGGEATRCTSGRTCHIVRHEDDMWTVEGDERREIFLTPGSALNYAREIASDPDLLPLTRI